MKQESVVSNWVTSSMEGKFGLVGETFVQVINGLFMEKSDMFFNGVILKIFVVK
jgi:hypothetical protein